MSNSVIQGAQPFALALPTAVTASLPEAATHSAAPSSTSLNTGLMPSNPTDPPPRSNLTAAPYTTLTPRSSRKPKTRTIVLGDGRHVDFTANDVGVAPAISFAEDLPQLNRMWDDTSKYWDGHSVLRIKGIPIPIVYWRQVYGRTKAGAPLKPGQWQHTKGSWREWKVRYPCLY